MRINIKHKHDCSGCTACASICPKQCITLVSDKLGFRYPSVEISKCIDCGLCINTCPFINISPAKAPKICYAASNQNDLLRKKSSSGGIFIELAKRILFTHGVVFGAVFDCNGNVVHCEATTLEEVRNMMGSKYVQSDISGIFPKVKKYLQLDYNVLFTGTPCQIAGLNHYLKKTHANLFTVEIVCHGVPAPFVWEKYLLERKGINSCCHEINKINFRDKRNGWRKFGLSINFRGEYGCKDTLNNLSYYESFSKDPYMQAFLTNLSLRPSCYSCKAKSGVSHADISIGDFWGIEHLNIPDDDLGSSCIIVRSEKGYNLLKSIDNLNLTECTYDQILSGNPCLEYSVYQTDASLLFKKAIFKHSLNKSISIAQNPSLWSRIRCALVRRLK